jgi:hypothetical protein
MESSRKRNIYTYICIYIVCAECIYIYTYIYNVHVSCGHIDRGIGTTSMYEDVAVVIFVVAIIISRVQDAVNGLKFLSSVCWLYNGLA